MKLCAFFILFALKSCFLFPNNDNTIVDPCFENFIHVKNAIDSTISIKYKIIGSSNDQFEFILSFDEFILTHHNPTNSNEPIELFEYMNVISYIDSSLIFTIPLESSEWKKINEGHQCHDFHWLYTLDSLIYEKTNN